MSHTPYPTRPGPVELDGRVLLALEHARRHLDAFHDRHGRRWPLDGYVVTFEVDPGRARVAIRFGTKIDDWMEGPAEEKYGPGVSYVLSLDDYSLIETVYPR